jgi:hypothetical protein
MSGGAIKKGITNTITYLLLINFINLTANFYQLSNLDQTLLKYDDPYDSVAEIVLEYFLEMDEDTVPDTELPDDKRKIFDLKSLFSNRKFHFPKMSIRYEISCICYFKNLYQDIAAEKLNPPPKSIFFKHIQFLNYFKS